MSCTSANSFSTLFAVCQSLQLNLVSTFCFILSTSSSHPNHSPSHFPQPTQYHVNSSLQSSPLSPSITHTLFHSRLKTHFFTNPSHHLTHCTAFTRTHILPITLPIALPSQGHKFFPSPYPLYCLHKDTNLSHHLTHCTAFTRTQIFPITLPIALPSQGHKFFPSPYAFSYPLHCLHITRTLQWVTRWEPWRCWWAVDLALLSLVAWLVTITVCQAMDQLGVLQRQLMLSSHR